MFFLHGERKDGVMTMVTEPRSYYLKEFRDFPTFYLRPVVGLAVIIIEMIMCESDRGYAFGRSFCAAFAIYLIDRHIDLNFDLSYYCTSKKSKRIFRCIITTLVIFAISALIYVILHWSPRSFYIFVVLPALLSLSVTSYFKNHSSRE